MTARLPKLGGMINLRLISLALQPAPFRFGYCLTSWTRLGPIGTPTFLPGPGRSMAVGCSVVVDGRL